MSKNLWSWAVVTSAAVTCMTLWTLGGPPAGKAASFPAARGKGGAVVSPERASTEVGLAILRQGGNAADAAVATALAMAVVHPEAGNLGGGGFAVVKFGDEIASLDFRETAPAAAHREMYLDAEGEPIPKASWIGPLAAGVPGSPSGLWELHRRFGRLAWPDVVKPAFSLARDGFVVSRRLHEIVEKKRTDLALFPETAAVWLPDDAPPAMGSTMKIPALAATLDAYSRLGPDAILRGPVAEAIEAASSRHGGILTTADLAAYRAAWREPVRFGAFGWDFASMDLPSSGGFLVASGLHLLEGLHWADLPRGGADRGHLLAEAWRRTFADRLLLGDPASTEASVAELLEPARLEAQVRGIDPSQAASSDAIHPGASLGRPAATESDETNHLAVADADGNLVSLTTTLNGAFGCRLLVPEAGFFLNNEMDDFSTAPRRPNVYGLIQGPANEVAAGRRMLSSMSPVIGWKGAESIALGGRGGSRIPTGVTQILLNLIVDGDELQAAIDRPRLHHQWLPDRLFFETGAVAPETRTALEKRGHRFEELELTSRIHAVRILEDGRFEAAGDPRGPAVGAVVSPEDAPATRSEPEADGPSPR